MTRFVFSCRCAANKNARSDACFQIFASYELNDPPKVKHKKNLFITRNAVFFMISIVAHFLRKLVDNCFSKKLLLRRKSPGLLRILTHCLCAKPISRCPVLNGRINNRVRGLEQIQKTFVFSRRFCAPHKYLQ